MKGIRGPRRGCAGVIRRWLASVLPDAIRPIATSTDIGDELAAARALADLARRMLAVTAHDIEAVTNKPVTPLH